ncbi:dihydropteroate synthase [Candidatus Bipolaricaulota bacterium]
MFLVVGELINATRKSVAKAIEERDEEEIRRLARAQCDAGAEAVDLNAGHAAETELENLLWLIEVAESEIGTAAALSIDTSNPAVMEKAIRACAGRPMINSISNEPGKTPLIEFAADVGCDVIGLAMGENGIPTSSPDRVAEAEALVKRFGAAGGDPERLYVDLICMSVATSAEQGRELLESVRVVKAKLPVKTFAAVSNVSFGLPNRRLLNRAYLAMLIEAGLDGAILDPTDAEMQDALCAARTLTGADRFCMDYIGRHRGAKRARGQ